MNAAPTRGFLSRKERWAFAPLLLVMIAILLANSGVRMAGDAKAASTSATVTATVSAIASTATNGCTSAIGISITQGGLPTANNGNCVITFGSSNNSGVTLTAVDSNGGSFFPQQASNFADAGSDCAAMTTTDQVGYKVGSGATTSTINKCSPGETAAANTRYSDVPDVAETVCTTSANGSQDCEIIVGVNESGSDATADSYVGTINFTSS